MSEFIFPKRMIHLDFHTGPWIPDVARDFDPERFADTFKRAHVDSVTVFALCHHGQAYWNTDRPERHPGLPKGLDLMGEQIKALHRAGIRAPVYISVQCNEFCANTHPDWIALGPDLRQIKGSDSVFHPGWQIMDMSSPYQDHLADLLAEVLQKYAPLDGVFMDMCWDQPSCSKWAIQGMQERGLDPRDPEARNQYARQVVLNYMRRYRDMIDAAHEGYPPCGVWFNSRPKTNLQEEKQFLRHVEIEALPTGGWGYAYFPYVARFVRPLGLPTLSHTGRFFKSWGDNQGLKPEAALRYECCQILSQQMTSGVGDLLHPRGVPNPAVYDLIGRVYGYIASCEPYVEGGKVLSEIGLLMDAGLGDNPGPAGLGAVRALQQLQQQFDVITEQDALHPYRLVIVAETTPIGPDLRERLRSYVRNGGALILCGPAGLDAKGQPLLQEQGIMTHGPSPYTHTFLHPQGAAAQGISDYGHVMYEQGYRMTAGEDADVLIAIGEPYFQRDYTHFSGHEYTPESTLSDYAAAVQCGRVITFAVPFLEAYGKHAQPVYRRLLGNCIDLLMPDPLVRADGPSKLETTVVRTPNSLVVHLISFCPERRAEGLDIVEDALPLVNMPIRVRCDREPSRVYLAPGEQDVPFGYDGRYIHTAVTVLDGHAMLVCTGATG